MDMTWTQVGVPPGLAATSGTSCLAGELAGMGRPRSIDHARKRGARPAREVLGPALLRNLSRAEHEQRVGVHDGVDPAQKVRSCNLV